MCCVCVLRVCAHSYNIPRNDGKPALVLCLSYSSNNVLRTGTMSRDDVGSATSISFVVLNVRRRYIISCMKMSDLLAQKL